jgi:hypothetical protein
MRGSGILMQVEASFDTCHPNRKLFRKEPGGKKEKEKAEP